MVWPVPGRHQDDRKDIARNRKGKIVGRNRELSTRIKRKQCYRRGRRRRRKRRKKKKKGYLILFWRAIDMHHVCHECIALY